ncbi:hypothetical protein GQ457_04G033060 [Hibiscus cannabinus]
MQTDDPKKTEHLVSLDGAKERLHLLKVDLLEEGCFDYIVDGCQGVFHTASLVLFSSTDSQPFLFYVVSPFSHYQVELTDPAIKGTLEHWYMASKTLAEEAAWKYAKENGIDLLVLSPGFMFGPLLQPTLNGTSEVVLGFTKGENTFPSSTYWLVDVRDVAYAHIQAFEIPSASGRYCLIEKVVQFPEILKTLNQLYPTLGLQAKSEDEDKPLEPAFKVSQEKAKGLGVGFIPWDVGLRDIIESLKDKGFLSI